MMITAEATTNKYGSTYTYYRCTKRRTSAQCSERPVTKRSLETQLATFLSSLTISPQTEKWARERVANGKDENDATRLAQLRSCAAAIEEVNTQLRELTSLRLRRLMSDSEFALEKERLETERDTLQKSLSAAPVVDRSELLEEIISFSKCAVDWFWRGDDRAKRLIVKIAGWNFFLKGKILSVQAAKPFFVDPFFFEILLGRRLVDDVRTFSDMPNPEGERLLDTVSDMAHELDARIMLENIRALRRQIEK